LSTRAATSELDLPLTARVVRFFGHGGAVAFGLILAMMAASALSAWLFAHTVRQRLHRDVARMVLDDNTDIVDGVRWSVANADEALRRAQEAAEPPADRPYLVVSIEERRLWYRRGADVLFTAQVATGSGKTLVGSGGDTYRFETPRGRLTVQSKETDPVWSPPTWHYEEQARKKNLGLVKMAAGDTIRTGDGAEISVSGDQVLRRGRDGTVTVLTPETGGELVVDGKLVVPPLGTSMRKHAGVLGSHRLNLGDGYALHGTNQPDSIGQAVSHGCVRLRNEDIAQLHAMVAVGTPVYIY
jgi:lipoprotein-anchoring transpeptidase ErfK/SrfK